MIQLSEEYKRRIRRRNKVRAVICAVCLALVVIGLIVVNIIK